MHVETRECVEGGDAEKESGTSDHDYHPNILWKKEDVVCVSKRAFLSLFLCSLLFFGSFLVSTLEFFLFFSEFFVNNADV